MCVRVFHTRHTHDLHIHTHIHTHTHTHTRARAASTPPTLCLPHAFVAPRPAVTRAQTKSAVIVAGPTCPALIIGACTPAIPCYDHSQACGADGKFTVEECALSVGCKACFPNSRCGMWGGPTSEGARQRVYLPLESYENGMEFR